MQTRDMIVIGGSAGALEALVAIASGLPKDLPAAVFLVLHTRHGDMPRLTMIMSHASPLPVSWAVDGEPIYPAHAYLAPGGHNLLIERGRVRVLASPKEYTTYPSINAVFRSAALAYGPRVIGVVLSGLLDDGTAGLWEIKRRGGIAIVQSPADAKFTQMPESALRQVAVDYSVPVAEMATLLERLIGEPLDVPLERSTPPTVLIVEDEAIVALNLEKQLATRGYTVSGVVASGEAAISSVEADPPDIVLMDIVLPGAMDGTEAARVIWERHHVPVVYLTAHGDEPTLARVKATEPYGYVLKPFDMGQVHVAIQLALDRRDREVPPA